MKHDKNCRWEKLTEKDCEYRNTSEFCPHDGTHGTPDHRCTCKWAKTPPLPKPPAIVPDAPNFPKIDPKECTHTGYFVPMGYDSFPVANGDAVLTSYGVICMRCGTVWPHVQLLESPLSKLPKDKKPDVILPS